MELAKEVKHYSAVKHVFCLIQFLLNVVTVAMFTSGLQLFRKHRDAVSILTLATTKAA